MKKLILFGFLATLLVNCKEKKHDLKTVGQTVVINEDSSSEEEQDQWTILFDGSSFDGWHVYPGKKIPSVWKLEDGAMILHPEDVRKDGERFNLVTDREYNSFILSLEWMVSKGANSGIMWGVVEDPKYNEPYYTGPEIQVLDNINHPDAKNGTTHQAGSLYDMVAPSKDVVKPIGEWNSCVITIDHKSNYGSVVLNGEKIVEFPVNGDDWQTMVANSKFADWPDFGKYSTGRIALQDHGEKIKIGYRNIKIREL